MMRNATRIVQVRRSSGEREGWSHERLREKWSRDAGGVKRTSEAEMRRMRVPAFEKIARTALTRKFARLP
ncbi:MAG: hypothetical protein WBQ94_04010 [Terracidiphilus sp.]